MDKVTVTTADVECVKAMIAKTSFSRNGASPSTSACEIAARHRTEATRQSQEQIRLLREALEGFIDDLTQRGHNSDDTLTYVHAALVSRIRSARAALEATTQPPVDTRPANH